MACSDLPAGLDFSALAAGGSAAAWRGAWAARRSEATVLATPAVSNRARGKTRRRMAEWCMGRGVSGAPNRNEDLTADPCRRPAISTGQPWHRHGERGGDEPVGMDGVGRGAVVACRCASYSLGPRFWSPKMWAAPL